MSLRVRKLIGACALLALATAWALVAMAMAQSVLDRVGTLGQIAYYVVAGFGWVLPALPLVSWMSRAP
jgi:Protein of unknown function (DUF2842)